VHLLGASDGEIPQVSLTFLVGFAVENSWYEL